MKTLNEIITAVNDLDSKEFDLLFKAMQARITASRLAKEATLLKIGAQVKFDAKTRGIITGEVIKVNTKTVKVKTKGNVIWNVSKTLIEAA